MRKFGSAALPFSKVACAVKGFYNISLIAIIGIKRGTNKGLVRKVTLLL